MTYRSFQRLPAINSYDEALALLKSVKPIRNSSPKAYPVGNRPELRRDHYRFSIRMVGDAESLPSSGTDGHTGYKPCIGAQDGDIELLLYKTPVITFHKPANPDQADQPQEITLNPGPYMDGRWSSADCAFISEILTRYIHSAVTNKRRLVLTQLGSQDTDFSPPKIVLDKGESIRLQLNTHPFRHLTPATIAITDTNGQTVSVQPKPKTSLRLNRKETNRVRAQYGAFYRYAKGMIGLRKEAQPGEYYNSRSGETEHITDYFVNFTKQEVMSVVPTVQEEKKQPFGPMLLSQTQTVTVFDPKYSMFLPKNKPAKLTKRMTYDNYSSTWKESLDPAPYERWLQITEEFLTKVRDGHQDADEGVEAQRLYEAFVWLAFYCSEPNHAYSNSARLGQREDHDILLRVPADMLLTTLDEIIFKFHSEEVFERVPVKPGTLPSVRYETWVTREVA